MSPAARSPRVLVLHNRYRLHGGEERAVDFQLAALARAGVEHRALFRDSAGAGRVRAASAMLRGGADRIEVEEAVRGFGATVLHAHNIQPLFGPGALLAARRAGARVVLSLHNFRLFCAIGVAFRDGATCFRCRGRLTLPGFALACRGSAPESAVYAAALALHQPGVLESVDAFVTSSAFAAGQLARLGLPPERVEVLPHYLPASAFAWASRAHEGRYVLLAGRLAPEKGPEVAVEAAALSGVPLKVTGDGPLAAELRELAARRRAPVEFLGRVPREELERLLAGAAAVAMPSVGPDVFPFSALEAMAAGVPVVAARTGGLPEMVGEECCVPRRDPAALAAALDELWRDPERRRREGEALLERARARHAERRYVAGLLELYGRLGAAEQPRPPGRRRPRRRDRPVRSCGPRDR
jgi:glycosyltransferase involved in cell wall biosynthesis